MSRSFGPARHWLRKKWRALPAASAVGGLGLLLLLQVPWLGGVFTVVGLDDSEALRTTVIVVVLIALYEEVSDLSGRLSRPEESLRFRDPVEIHAYLGPKAHTLKGTERSADVLAVHLNSVWPNFSYMLERPETAGFTLRIAALQDPAGLLAPWIPATWHDDAKCHIESARSAALDPALRCRGIEIEVYEYNFLPAVRGVRLGNGDLVISFMLWDGDKGADHGSSSEFIPHDDHSLGAEAARELFNSWFCRALQCSSDLQMAERSPAAPLARD